MSPATDFRLYSFDPSRVESSGKYVGRNIYWKLHFIENIFRVIINSVLSAQIGPEWWATAVDGKIRARAKRFKKDYLKRPWHTAPGSHNIYYVHLQDLNEIMRANSHLFLPVLPEIDSWIARIEQLRLPRNIVCHMNFPNPTDRKRIDVFWFDCKSLIGQLQATVVSKSWALQIP